MVYESFASVITLRLSVVQYSERDMENRSVIIDAKLSYTYQVFEDPLVP